MEILEISEFSEEGVFFEESFDRRVAAFDWSRFNDKPVRVSNCGLTDVPGWVYLQIGIQLSGRAKKIFFGDPKNPKKLYSREKISLSKEELRHDT